MHGRLKTRKLKIWTQDYLASRYMWPNIEQAVRKVLGSVDGNTPRVLDVGCGHKPYQDLFQGCEYIGLNYGKQDASPDILGSALALPIRSASVNIVFATQVIEHVPAPQQMLSECARVLRPEGYLILTGPFYWPLHEEPLDFFRFTKHGFAVLLQNAGFSTWEIREDGGDWAQAFLCMTLRFPRRWQVPFRCISNLTGAILDRLSPKTSSPANYTVIAKL